MYKAAEEQVNKGLSPFARALLAFFSALFGILMISIAPPTDKAIYFYAFGGFCLLIFFACVTRGKVRQFVGSIIGCALFAISGWYLYTQITTGPLATKNQGEPSIINSILFFIAFGIPGITYAIKVKFGKNKKT